MGMFEFALIRSYWSFGVNLVSNLELVLKEHKKGWVEGDTNSEIVVGDEVGNLRYLGERVRYILYRRNDQNFEAFVCHFLFQLCANSSPPDEGRRPLEPEDQTVRG
jgi:hypothetical protein